MSEADIGVQGGPDSPYRMAGAQCPGTPPGILQKIATQVPGMVYQYELRADGSSCFPYASEQIRRIYRVSPAEVREDATPVLAVLHPDDRATVERSIRESAVTLQPWQLDYRVRFADGEVRWLHGTSAPEPQADGSILWHGFIMDITERKEAQQARAMLQAQFQQSQKVESIGRLAGGVAHDFNNLLTSILGFSELALDDIEADSAAATCIRHVIATANRGASLTQQLLAFARKQLIKPQRVDLNQVTRELLPMIERLIGEDIELDLVLSRNLGSVMIDTGSLEQVLVNLVVNARDAMSGGGRLLLETGDVCLDAAYAARHPDVVPGWYVMLAVTDSGSGMQAEVLDRVFEPFFTTKPQGQGTGLGLATCYGILRQASGHIHAYSEPGLGACFKVFLPRQDGAAGEQDRALPQPEAPTVSVCSETILVVEDEAAILQIASTALGNLGYRVLAAANGAAALQLAGEFEGRIDLLFTDVVMPKLGGRDLAQQLGQLRTDLKVLYTSGYTEDAIVKRGVLQDGIEFMQKPYSLQLLAERIREVLDRS